MQELASVRATLEQQQRVVVERDTTIAALQAAATQEAQDQKSLTHLEATHKLHINLAIGQSNNWMALAQQQDAQPLPLMN